MKVILVLAIVLSLDNLALGQNNPYFSNGKNVIVQLFEWKWKDIARECEDFLAPKGYAGVQISPPNEHVVINSDNLNRPWWERYHPVSYQLVTRSGNEEDLADMINRCNKVGVRIYVDVVFNHMSGQSGVGTNGSTFDITTKSYPSVPYNATHFHTTCDVNDYNDADNVRNCQIDGKPDLDQSQPYVRQKITEFLNKLVGLGVNGFRVDSAKYMSPADLAAIYENVNNLNTKHGFEENSRPVFYHELDDLGYEAVSKYEYIDLGPVLDVRHSIEIANLFFFKKGLHLFDISTWGAPFGCMENASNAVHFVDNPKYQRSQSLDIITYRNKTEYLMANALMLGHPYVEHPKIMSSFSFDNPDQGPPSDENGQILSPEFDENGQCTNGWICEHRWNGIANMIEFRNMTYGYGFSNPERDLNYYVISREGKGGMFIHNGFAPYVPGMEDGNYCDIITGNLVDGECTGVEMEFTNGIAFVNSAADPVAAIAYTLNSRK